MSKLIVLAIILLLLPTVHSLGISPTKQVYDFEPGKKITGSFTVVNSENKEIRLFIVASGEVAKYVTLHNKIVELKETEGSKSFTYEITLPNEFDKPGLHEGEIQVLEVPKDAEEEGAFMGTAIGISTIIKVRVPYPGKYAETRLDVSEANVNESVTFVLPVTNLGEQDILAAKAGIEIRGPTNDVLKTVPTDEKAIKSKETKELLGSWQANVNPGIYHAIATVTYDEKITTAERNFAVGNLLIDIIGAEVKGFKLGGVAKITLTLQNKWNQDVPEVYANLFVYDDKGEQIYETKSASIPLKGLATGTLPVFWDTQGIPSGAYSAKIVLHYVDKTTEKPLKFVVGTDSFDAQIVGLTGKVTDDKGGASKASPINMFLIVQIVFIAANIGLFFYLKKKLSKN